MSEHSLTSAFSPDALPFHNESMGNPDRMELQRQIDELVALVTRGREDIDSLSAGAAASSARADTAERRADAAERRADAAERRADAADVRADDTQRQVEELRADIAIDRELIAELQADGVVSREHAAQLEKALATSRTIGAAVGILMASRHVDQDQALRVLKEASSRSNTPLRQIADTLVSGPAGRGGLAPSDG